MNTVNSNSKIELHFNIKLEDGSVADSTRVKGTPAVLQLGSGQTSTAFENALIGLAESEKKNFTLSSDDAVGAANSDNITVMAKADVPADVEIEEGTILAFPQINGAELPGIIRKITDKEVTVDFNHPLCGHSLKFEVEIIKVLDE